MTKQKFDGLKPEKEKVPSDLGVKIGTMEEDLWTKVRDEAKMLIKNHEQSLIIQKAMLELAEQKIKEEKEKI